MTLDKSPAELRDGAWVPKPGSPGVVVWDPNYRDPQQVLEARRAAYRRRAAAVESTRLRKKT